MKNEKLVLLPTGSTLLNLALSQTPDGGWPVGRIVNIVGDQATGKTFLALELIGALFNSKKYKDYKIFYDETECAMSIDTNHLYNYEIKDFLLDPPSKTIEDFYKSVLDKLNTHSKFVYILDSLDALSDEDSIKRDICEGAYRVRVATVMNQFFKDFCDSFKEKEVLLVIISQLRDNIGVMFGSKQRRAGGKALNFFASHIIWLYSGKEIEDRNRVIGTNVRVKVKKNKIAPDKREISFPLYHDYGLDDIESMVDFLIDENIWKKPKGKRIIDTDGFMKDMMKNKIIDEIEKGKRQQELRDLVAKEWYKIEESIKINRRKYGDFCKVEKVNGKKK